MRPVCLAIGGSDSSGGAGIQADLAAFADLGVKGCCAITALTAQSPLQVKRIEPSPLIQLEAEIDSILDYYDVAAVKTGMLYDAARVRLVAHMLEQRHGGRPLVVDPVMLATSGACLLDAAALDVLIRELLPQARLVTPNIPEAAALLGRPLDDAVGAAKALAGQLNTAVLLKGGHGKRGVLLDVLCETNGETALFTHERKAWDIEQGHGTGCSLAAAITAVLAQGKKLATAVAGAESWLQKKRRGLTSPQKRG